MNYLEVDGCKRYQCREGMGEGGNITKMEGELDNWRGEVAQEEENSPAERRSKTKW